MITFYKITCNITGECYIGSTTRSLEKRMCGHKSVCNKTKSKQIIERDNYNYKELTIYNEMSKE